jgi:hypothetical protein
VNRGGTRTEGRSSDRPCNSQSAPTSRTLQFSQRLVMPLTMPTPIVSFDSTIGCGGCQPPDPNGDVGPTISWRWVICNIRCSTSPAHRSLAPLTVILFGQALAVAVRPEMTETRCYIRPA